MLFDVCEFMGIDAAIYASLAWGKIRRLWLGWMLSVIVVLLCYLLDVSVVYLR